METPTPNKRRMLCRLRAEFRQELGAENPTRAERVLVELAALTALRARGMRDQIIAGQEPDDEDFVRIVRATTSIVKAFKGHSATKKRAAKPRAFEERMRARQQRVETNATSIFDIIADEWRPWFRRFKWLPGKQQETWASWFTFLRILFGLPLKPDDVELFRQCLSSPDRRHRRTSRRHWCARSIRVRSSLVHSIQDRSPVNTSGYTGGDDARARMFNGGVRCVRAALG
jgi:hypothetical protein